MDGFAEPWMRVGGGSGYSELPVIESNALAPASLIQRMKEAVKRDPGGGRVVIGFQAVRPCWFPVVKTF